MKIIKITALENDHFCETIEDVKVFLKNCTDKGLKPTKGVMPQLDIIEMTREEYFNIPTTNQGAWT
jgi:hypothetical protein